MINKALILFLALCFFYSKIYSQTESVYSNKQSSTFGFTVGLTSSNYYGDSIHYVSGILFNGGVAFSLALNERFGANMDLLYTGKAFKTDSPIIKYRYYYIDIPLYLQINLNEKIRLNTGIQLSKFTNSQVSTLDSLASNATGVHTLKYNNLRDKDFSFLMGAEFNITKNLCVAARYTISQNVFFEKNKPYFGVFNFSFKYFVYRNYKQFFKTKPAE